MEWLSVLLIALGVAMDAFAVSICKGLALKNPTVKQMLIIGLWFGIFQGIMPIIGFYLGEALYSLISEVDAIVSFILLAIIGGNMIREGLRDDEDVDADIGMRTMLLLAIATSIDAMAVGVSMAASVNSIWMPALIITAVTFLFCFFGVRIGSLFGTKIGPKAEIAGGIVLILIGVEILAEYILSL